MTLRPKPARPGRGAMRARLEEILRVDHAGELGAVAIYRGQRAGVRRQARGRRGDGRRLAEMEGDEAVHLKAFDQAADRHASAADPDGPLWRAAGFALGAGTALMGEKAAHACTEAVETVIEQHYAGQIAELDDRASRPWRADLVAFPQRRTGPPRPGRGRRQRTKAPGYPLLSAVIRAGLRRAAIRISEKV